MNSGKRTVGIICAVVIGIWIAGCSKTAKHANQEMGFATPDEAVDVFINALRANDNTEVVRIFGPEAKEIIWSGDAVRDQRRRAAFLKAYDGQHRIDREGNKEVLIVGKNEWPFAIPLVQKNGRWIFDTAAGKEEILNRRIGRDELDTIQTMLAIVDAQREYARETYENGVREYAQKFASDPGTKNGLFWEAKEGEAASPLGPLIAEAREEGYFAKQSGGPVPYHGYYYRMLTGQGEHAEEGAYSYIVNGKMIGGFAVVAYPADYGNSGVMTFIVNHDGVVYQEDLGPDTEQEAMAMKLFDPDKTWTKVKDTSEIGAGDNVN